RLDGRCVGDEFAALVLPLLPTAVHQPGVLVAVVLEIPDKPGGEPVVVVAVGDDRVLGTDALRCEQLLEVLPGEQIADRTGLQVLAPVEPDSALDGAAVV